MNNAAILELADGNMGAMSVIRQLALTNKASIVYDLQRLDIIGWKIWVLYKDISKQNLSMLVHLVKVTDPDKLLRACSEKDRSGAAILADEIFNFGRD